jgi:hypothetical protein
VPVSALSNLSSTCLYGELDSQSNAVHHCAQHKQRLEQYSQLLKEVKG